MQDDTDTDAQTDAQGAYPAPNMRALKLLVTVMSALLIGGVVLLIYGIIDKSATMEKSVEGASEITLPAGAEVSDVFTVEDRLVVHAVGDNHDQRIYLFNIKNGKLAGEIGISGAGE